VTVADMNWPIVFLHTLGGRAIAVRVGKDKIVQRSVEIDGHMIQVRETVTEIAKLIDAEKYLRE
jgi:hypothetical protein